MREERVATAYTMTMCPLCRKEYAVTEWDENLWWFPHICVNGRSVYTVPKEFLS